MQTLTAGSFLNLENDGTVEALKFTACRLAEHSGNVVKENLNAAALENLANNLWEKAQYVTRETERRRLHQIFVENFSERFRELKPDVSLSENTRVENSVIAATIKHADSPEQTSAQQIVENGKNGDEAIEDASPAVIESPGIPTAVEGKKDEFLGFIESGESFTDAPIEATAMQVTTSVPEKNKQKTVQTEDEPAAETVKPENQPVEFEKSDSDDAIASGESEPSAEQKPEDKKSEQTTAAVGAQNKPQVSAAGAGAAKEPFELGKCTVNLSLVLLPVSASGERRKVIVSAMSHNLPPEIDFLEITEGEDLNEIAALVRDKLARFQQTLPAKYIEQLRQSKTKASKKTATVRTPLAVPTKTPVSQAKDEKTSGEQKPQPENSVETAKPKSATEQTDNATSAAFAPQVSKPIAANEIQGSLF